MTDRPIIFSASMVRALLTGTKTQTRWVMKPQPYEFQTEGRRYWNASGCVGGRICISDADLLRLHGWEVGRRLWVRESFVRYYELDGDDQPCSELLTCYRADGWPLDGWYDRDREETRDAPPWRSPTHMPRVMSRITLTVTEVRVQRLGSISEDDARAEGWPYAEADPTRIPSGAKTPAGWFRMLWSDLHGPASWDASPWVAAISFTATPANIDSLEVRR